jgi:hypothetical protein
MADKMKTLYEAQFDNNSRSICRVFATTEQEAIYKFRQIYPDKIVTKIYEP